MARENFKNIAIELFGELPGIFTPGLNGDQEFLDSLISNLEHVDEMKFIIPLSTIKEADRYLECAKKMNIRLGENIFSLGPNIKPVELYISRIYDNIHGGKGIVFNQKITNLEDYTIDADVSRRTISDNIPGVYSVTVLNGKGRANSYVDYDSLTNKDKLLLKQQLRKKVMAHEFNHLSVTARNPIVYDLVEFEEIAVERMALKALNINGKSNIITNRM